MLLETNNSTDDIISDLANLDFEDENGINRKLETAEQLKIVQDRWLVKSFDQALRQEQRPARKGVFYPSALGSSCQRHLYNCYNH